MTTIYALIPARAGSTRLPGKNVKPLGGKPLLVWTIEAARESGMFDGLVVSTDSPEYADIAAGAGAEVILRPGVFAGERSPDIEWVMHALLWLAYRGRLVDVYSILRPTSPFRDAQAIRQAMREFLTHDADSLRTVQPARDNLFKCWERLSDGTLLPVEEQPEHRQALYNSATQDAPARYVQNASMEIAWVRRTVLPHGCISGQVIYGHIYPTADLNTPEDWERAERMMAERTA